MTGERRKFRVKLKGAEGMEIAAIVPPFDIAAVYGRKGSIPVKGTVNGAPFRSSFMNMGEGHMMVVNAALRAAARCKAGDFVDVELELDEDERTVQMPSDLARAMKADKVATEGWSGMSFTHRKEYARWIEGAKKPETRERRLSATMEALRVAAAKKSSRKSAR